MEKSKLEGEGTAQLTSGRHMRGMRHFRAAGQQNNNDQGRVLNGTRERIYRRQQTRDLVRAQSQKQAAIVVHVIFYC